jgi:hypothetical protein
MQNMKAALLAIPLDTANLLEKADGKGVGTKKNRREF